MTRQIYKLLFLMSALILWGCECPYEWEKNDPYHRKESNHLTADLLTGLWQYYYAVGYEGTKDWILVRYPAGSKNATYTVHPNCRRIARGAFEGAAYLREIYLPETVSFIGEDAFAGCTSLQGIYFGEVTPTAVRSIEADSDSNANEVARYNLAGRPCSPNDKGVQIIVYSDFTTRTVIVD